MPHEQFNAPTLEAAREYAHEALVRVLEQGIEESGFSLSGPTDLRAAEHGEPPWVCNARAALTLARKKEGNA